MFADHEAATGRPLEVEALDLACIGSLAQMGFIFAAPLAHAERADAQAAAAAQLTWWTDRVRVALDRVGPP